MTGAESTPNRAGEPVDSVDAIDAVHLYWRPGCPYCAVLRRGLDKLGIETIEHNIWDDPDDAAIVRRYANGNETVPTVVIGDVGMVNPPAKHVAQHLELVAPHLLPNRSQRDDDSRRSPRFARRG